MDDVIALSRAVVLIPATLGFLHIPIGGIELAVDRALENLAVFQALRLSFVQRVSNPIIQAGANDDDLVIGHS